MPVADGEAVRGAALSAPDLPMCGARGPLGLQQWPLGVKMPPP